MKKFFVPLLLGLCQYLHGIAAGFDVKSSSIIDQPAVEVLGSYNNSWYVIGFEKPNHPDKPARFYILKYAEGFPAAKSSPVYPPFGEKTDYLRSAIINGKICIFYSRTEHLPDRPNMVDSRDGYKQIPKIMRQDYDPVTLLPTGEPVVVFDEEKEHFAACGIDITQSEDRSKTAVLIKHYFRQSKFKVILIDTANNVFEKTFVLETGKELINWRKLVVSNTGEISLEAKTQVDPLHIDPATKNVVNYFFFSIIKEQMKMIKVTSPNGDNSFAADPYLLVSNGGATVIWGQYADKHSPVLKSIKEVEYYDQFGSSATTVITPDEKVLAKTASYQNTKSGLDHARIVQAFALRTGEIEVLLEQYLIIEGKDKVTGAPTKTYQHNYILGYRYFPGQPLKIDFIDKRQSAQLIDYAFSFSAVAQNLDVLVFYNEDCSGDGEHGLALNCAMLTAGGKEPAIYKIVHTNEDFFTSMAHVYSVATQNNPYNNRILFTESKIVDFDVENAQIKFLEVKPK